jgi:hypothetical protein
MDKVYILTYDTYGGGEPGIVIGAFLTEEDAKLAAQVAQQHGMDSEGLDYYAVTPGQIEVRNLIIPVRLKGA